MTFADKLERRRLYSHVRENETGMPLLAYLCSHFARFDMDGWRREILAGNVLHNGLSASPESRLTRHDCVAFYPGETVEPDAELTYKIVYEDDELLVIDKPGNLCVHPAGPFFRHTLWHLIGSAYGEIHFVNRLDRETSGLLVAARNAKTAARMDNRFWPMHKEYLALVLGRFQGTLRASGVLELDTDSEVFKKRRFRSDATPSDTAEFADTELREEREVAPDMTLVRAIPYTGRHHQIRSTLYSLGYPLVDDKLYGVDERLFLKISRQTISMDDLKKLRMGRQALHSALLSFPHPSSGKMIHCESAADFRLFDEKSQI